MLGHIFNTSRTLSSRSHLLINIKSFNRRVHCTKSKLINPSLPHPHPQHQFLGFFLYDFLVVLFIPGKKKKKKQKVENLLLSICHFFLNAGNQRMRLVQHTSHVVCSSLFVRTGLYSSPTYNDTLYLRVLIHLPCFIYLQCLSSNLLNILLTFFTACVPLPEYKLHKRRDFHYFVHCYITDVYKSTWPILGTQDLLNE